MTVFAAVTELDVRTTELANRSSKLKEYISVLQTDSDAEFCALMEEANAARATLRETKPELLQRFRHQTNFTIANKAGGDDC